ncbi:pilus assembly PilX N-terminal domain-containing protein [Candidatus Saccharibacteria bacterium]|nr:pilus assembly PilX N-terminal domain-containing protein [Candidatus Saccharibacteria bacterium]
MFDKKGVSLITVLMFMLIATIAATATFKWLTSENKSSASRMQIQESRQSAIAGIQSVRAWMTNNANDVGAIIRQYILNNKTPISLNNRVVTQINDKQNFNVWLTGVSKDEHGGFKLKILSEGNSRNNSKHTEAAIFNVSGLYQIKPPVEKRKLNYDYAYFGGSVRNHGEVEISSMLINGNWHGNPPTVNKNIIITGIGRLSGNNVNILGSGCIGSDFYADNGIKAGSLFVGGTAHEFGSKPGDTTISRHAYFDGIVEHSKNGDKQILIGGNMTVKNLFKTHMGTGSSPITIKGNLCIDSSISQIQLAEMQTPSYNQSYSYAQPFIVKGDVWASHNYAFTTKGGDFSDKYTKLVLGDSSISKVFLPDAYPSIDYTTLRESKAFTRDGTWWSNYMPYVPVSAADDKYYFYVAPSVTDVTFDGTDFYVGGFKYPHDFQYGTGYSKKLSPYCDTGDDYHGLPKLHVTPWFKSKGSVSRSFSPKPITCADSVKKICDAIWEKKPGCDNAPYKVDDILVTAYDKFNSYASRGCAKNITIIDKNFVSNMNTCYEQSKNDTSKVYNGFLVVKVRSTEKIDHNSELKGKFIIIITNKPENHEMNLPPTGKRSTGEDSYVFLYLSQGANAMIKGQDYKTYNYFIYTLKNVGTSTLGMVGGKPEITPGTNGFNFGYANFQGSLYAVAENCAKISSITNSRPILFNQQLLDTLTQNGVICPASVTNCGDINGNPISDDDEDENDGLIDKMDPYFVSIAPRLNVTIESQYKSTETIAENTASNVDPSILVLPRIIYLSKDAPGRLKDYYSVLNLNGATEQKTPNRVQCNGNFNTTEPLYDGDESHLLTPGHYVCNYTSPNYGTHPFYVVINDVTGAVPEVKFKAPLTQALTLNGEAVITVHVGRANRNLTFDVSLNEVYPGWTIVPQSGITTERSGSGGKRYTVKLPASNSERDVDILRIITSETADDGDMYLTLTTPTEHCQLAQTETTYHVYLKARTNITRASISDYCNVFSSDNEICNNEVLERPDCDYYNNEWVTATGTGCSVNMTNNSWKCLTNTPISLAAVYANDVPPECEVIIPSSNNRINNPVGGTEAILYASIKRKKIELTVKTQYAQEKNTYIRIQEQDYSLDETCPSDSICKFKVLAGTPVVFSHEEYGEDKNHFRYWTCTGNNCPDPITTENEPVFVFYEPHTISAVFNKEYLCYYEDFTATTAFCGAYVEDCVDTCATVLNGAQACQPKNSKQPKSKWLMTYHNKGTGDNATYVRPTFGTSGSIYASSTQDSPSIILRNKSVGLFGTMNALVQTGIIDKSNTSDLLNSGLIFRSNGNEHLILNIFGTSKPGSTGELTFRVCKVQGQSIKNTTEGNCKLVTTKEGTPLSITNKTFIKVRFVIDENDLLKVTAQIGDIGNNKTWNGELNVGSFSCNSNNHSYAGISLADPDFKIYENLWVSSLLNDVCSEVPSIKCQFKDYNHVPINTDVLPEVTIVNGGSDWFSEKNCIMDYYYNGCDNTTSDNSSYCTSTKDVGQLDSLGAKIPSGEQYHFTEAGDHGNRYGNKKRWEASVKVVCPGDQTSLDLAQDYYSCNFFRVGEDTVSCSKDIEIYKDQQYLAANIPYEFPIPGGKINMRSAQLHIHIEKDNMQPNQDLGASLKIQLQSSNGMRSSIRTIDKTGPTDINVNNIDDGSSGFNQEEVSKVIITSDKNININNLHINSHCQNKLDLKCAENANYSYAQGWEIKINNQPPEVTCTYKSTDLNIESEEDVSCSETMYLTYKQGYGFYWYDPNSTAPSFTVTIKRKNVSDSCSIPGVKPGNNLFCSIPSGQETISYGTEAPTFSFKYGQAMPGLGWSSFNINYQVTLTTPTTSDSVVKEGTAKMGDLLTYRYPKEDPESGNYKYKVKFTIGAWSQIAPCEAGFTIQDKEKTPPTLDCDKSFVNNNGKFTAYVNNPDNLSFNCTFNTEIIIDNLGHTQTIDGHTQSGSGNDPIYYTYSPGKAGTYYYTAQIGDSKCIYTRTVQSPIELTCPATITDQNTSDPIVVIPTVKNCDECAYKIFDGDLEKSSDLVFYDNNGSGTKQYKLQATDKNENIASCNFNVAFKSQQGGTVVELDYGESPQTFDVGTHTVKCISGRGRLVCECPILQYDYNNCLVKVNGIQRDPFMYNIAVDGDPECGKTDQLILEVLPPIKGTGNKEQPPGIKCSNNW